MGVGGDPLNPSRGPPDFAQNFMNKP